MTPLLTSTRRPIHRKRAHLHLAGGLKTGAYVLAHLKDLVGQIRR